MKLEMLALNIIKVLCKSMSVFSLDLLLKSLIRGLNAMSAQTYAYSE